MRYIECSNCNKTAVAINESVKVDDKDFCIECYKSVFSTEASLQGKRVSTASDPTICAFCSKDNGDVEFNRISVYPVCENCKVDIKNKEFPNWVKAFFAAVLLIVVFSFFWNWKYYRAYNNLHEASTLFSEGQTSKAADLMFEASNDVPEVEDIKTFAFYFKGLDLVMKDSCEEAFKMLNVVRDKLPPDYNVQFYINQAKIGICFNKKDYEGFLGVAQECLDYDTTMARSWATVAAAYACVYARDGQDSVKDLAYQYFQKAAELDTTEETNQYKNRFEHRIYTREIISADEFAKRFPNGWTKN